MQHISIIWGTILFLIFAGLTAFGLIYKNKSKDYKQLEDNLKNAAKQYVDQKFLYPNENDTLKVTSKELEENDIKDILKKDEETCEGYVIVTKKNEIYQYSPYIKCSKYQTKNYQE